MRLLRTIQKLQAHKLLLSVGLTLVLAVAMIGGPGTAKSPLTGKASATNCHKVSFVYHWPHYIIQHNPDYMFYTDYIMHNVPSTSPCLDINITNIQNGVGPGGHCAYIVAWYYVGDTKVGQSGTVYICTDPVTEWHILDSDVPNGTHYWVWDSFPGLPYVGANATFDIFD